MDFASALKMPISFESNYFKSKAWQLRKEEIENASRESAMVGQRLNLLIQQANRR